MRSRDIEERLARIEDRMATRDDVAEILAALGRRRAPRRIAATVLLCWPGILS